MPELPEVEVVRRGLLLHLPGCRITGLATDGKTLREPVPEAAMKRLLPGAAITDVTRRAKYLLIHLDSGAVMIIHLGMTGRLGLHLRNAPPAVHDHVCWSLDNGMELRLNDTRRFGLVKMAAPDQAATLEQTVFRTSGPEPLSPSFDGRYLHDTARGRALPVKSFIMDTRVVVGIGNIYANESLFSAGIRPNRKAGAISLGRYETLAENIKTVLERAIACGGSTISDFISASGENGYFQVHFNVYGKKGEPCPRCSRLLSHGVIGGRATFFCRKCQR